MRINGVSVYSGWFKPAVSVAWQDLTNTNSDLIKY